MIPIRITEQQIHFNFHLQAKMIYLASCFKERNPTIDFSEKEKEVESTKSTPVPAKTKVNKTVRQIDNTMKKINRYGRNMKKQIKAVVK